MQFSPRLINITLIHHYNKRTAKIVRITYIQKILHTATTPLDACRLWIRSLAVVLVRFEII